MSKKMLRGVAATIAAGAMIIPFAPSVSAELDDFDGSPVVIVPDETVSEAEVFRIADSTRILTAIEASQSREDWGRAGVFRGLVLECNALGALFDGLDVTDGPFELGDIFFPILEGPILEGEGFAIECVVVEGPLEVSERDQRMDIIVARSDDYPDALSAAPLADVLDAPILLNPSAALDINVRNEIQRLGTLGGDRDVVVHVLGGTNALSNEVETAIDLIPNVNETRRYQGIDRYETAVGIAEVLVDLYRLDSDIEVPDVNAYITTGINFPDALAAGAAAANNDGVVVLTKGDELDDRGFTEQFLIDLRNFVLDDLINTSENFVVGGPAAKAVADNDIRLAPDGEYVGADRYETATITATKTFSNAATSDYAVVSGQGFADALVAGGYIANLDGPLLLTKATTLSPVTAAYLMANIEDGDRIFTFGGPDTLRLAVTNAIVALLEAKFDIDDEIE